MSDGLYVGMNGATARLHQLDSIADNLANAQTPGFKGTRPAFETYVRGDGFGPGASDHKYVAAAGTGVDLREGQPAQTNRPLDVMPEPKAYLAVQMADGSTGYTRNGSIQVDARGQLTVLGRPVLGAGGGPIAVPPGRTPVIGSDGVVRADDLVVDRLGLHALEGGVDRLPSGILVPNASAGAAQPLDAAKVAVGTLELANISVLQSTIELVNAQRNFDTSMQALQTYRRLDEKMSDVGRVRS